MTRIEITPPIDISPNPCKTSTSEGYRDVSEEKRQEQVNFANSIWEQIAEDPDAIDVTNINMPEAMKEQFLLRRSQHQSTKEEE